jgi:threonine dehydrogenase-like Zn-dependent dehydrogenase
LRRYAQMHLRHVDDDEKWSLMSCGRVQARSFGCKTIDLTEAVSVEEQIKRIVGVPEVDSAIDCVGCACRQRVFSLVVATATQ